MREHANGCGHVEIADKYAAAIGQARIKKPVCHGVIMLKSRAIGTRCCPPSTKMVVPVIARLCTRNSTVLAMS